MDIERINGVLGKAIAGLQDGEIEGLALSLEEGDDKKDLAPVIAIMAKDLGSPLGKWSHNKGWDNYARWNLIPQKGGILLKVDKLDSNKKPFPKNSMDASKQLHVKVRRLSDGSYEVEGKRPGSMDAAKDAAKAAERVWQNWYWYVDD